MLDQLDHAAIVRSLSQIADQRTDAADAFFERREDVELPSEDGVPGLRVWRESGLAVRLVRNGRSWLVSRDGISQATFTEAVRRAARAAPRTPYPFPTFPGDRWTEAPTAPDLLELPAAVHRAVRAHHVPLAFKLGVRRHRRWVRVVGTQVSSAMEQESFYSVTAETENGRDGWLFAGLAGAAELVARRLVQADRAAGAEPPPPWRGPTVLGPSAAAVLLHEAVAHALEVDTLALGGHPEAAVGVELGFDGLDVFDDPRTAPPSVRRQADDEGYPVLRRCLLRAGVVEQPLCDSLWARRSEILRPGAGRRSDRHLPPGPRSTHLELVPGTASREELLASAEGGLFFPVAERGRLDPQTGEFVLVFPYGFRIENQVPGPAVGRTAMRGHFTDLLGAVRAVGRDVEFAGAGWCAKTGMKLPVWATAPDLGLEGIAVRP